MRRSLFPNLCTDSRSKRKTRESKCILRLIERSSIYCCIQWQTSPVPPFVVGLSRGMEFSEKCGGHVSKCLSVEEMERMKAQDSRLVPEFRANQLEENAKKHWDLFYKRNTTSFFKDRHWTTREFHELLDSPNEDQNGRCLIEVGCGVGNLIYPLIEDGLKFNRIYACDLSPRAVEFVKEHKLFDPEKITAFQADVTIDNCFLNIENSVDVATLVFVLSAIHPQKFQCVAKNLFKILRPGGLVLFRDYGLYDMAQLRFKPGHKIADNFYMRQDGTRSYYFSTSEIEEIFKNVGFEMITCTYVQRRTVNLKEKIDVPRIFVQAKFRKT